MIYTVTLNPSVDYYIRVDTIDLGQINRFDAYQYSAGGKGINCSKILDLFSVPSKAVYFCGGLTGQFIADLVLQILSYVAQVERDNIKQRQAEGIKAAQNRGVKFGRPRKTMPEGFHTAVQMVNDGELTYREGARQIGVSKSTFYKKAMEYNNRNMNS